MTSCPCPLQATQPWSARDAPCSPMSFVFGAILVAVALAIGLAAPLRPWVGWLILGVLAAGLVAALVVQFTRGHRGWCLLRRALWFAIAIPGAPLRLLASFA